MTLSPEIRITDFEKSMKKYFVDNLQSLEAISLFFEWIQDTPRASNGTKLDKWIIFSFGEIEFGTVAQCSVEANLFTRNDSEGTDLSALQDTFFNYIIDEDQINGLVSIPYYNVSESPWVKVGGIIPFIQRIFGKEESKDKTTLTTIQLLCKWGSK